MTCTYHETRSGAEDIAAVQVVDTGTGEVLLQRNL
jgi:hypothetical protein